MQRFKNILVVCDVQSDNQPALLRAVRLARANNAQVTLVDVMDAAPGELHRLFAALPGARPTEIADQLRSDYDDRLAALAEGIRAEGIAVSVTVLEGTAFLEIIRHVIRSGADLLIKTVNAGGGSTGLFSRGCDLHLLRKCPCPVWMLKDSDGATADNILVAVDPDPDDLTRRALNTQVMEMATSLSEADGAHLHVVNVWRLQEEQALRSGRLHIDTAEIARVLEHERIKSKARLDQLMAAFPAGKTLRSVHHIKGLAGDVILAYAARHGIDAIVMGTVGRTGVSGFFIGNTAEEILNAVNCSVIAVKPPGFVSPVAADLAG